MSQLDLFPLPPILTARQQAALDAIAGAGWDGLASDEVGQAVHQHPDGAVCEWCGSAGRELGDTLRRKGLVAQRRRRAPGGDGYMVWVVAGTPGRRPEVRSFDLPEGF